MSGALGNFAGGGGPGGSDAILGILDALNQDQGPQTFARGAHVAVSQAIRNQMYQNMLKQIAPQQQTQQPPFGAPPPPQQSSQQQQPAPQVPFGFPPQRDQNAPLGSDADPANNVGKRYADEMQPIPNATGGDWRSQLTPIPSGAGPAQVQQLAQQQQQQVPFGFNLDMLRRLPPQVGMPILQQLLQQQFTPKPHTWAATRDGQIYDTLTGELGPNVRALSDARAAAQNKQQAEGIAGSNATGNIGGIDSLPIDPGQREALRQLVLSGDPKAIETYRDVVKNLSEKKEGGITTRNVEVGDQTKIGQFDKNGNLVGFVKGPNGQEITAPRSTAQVSVNLSGDDPEVQGYVNQILNGNASLQNVPVAKRGSVVKALDARGGDDFSPLAGSRFTLEASRITNTYKKLPQYELTVNGQPYLRRIQAAREVPGSVSDQDLLDSLTKLNTSGNAITDAQVKIITDGKSLSDWAGVLYNRLGNGGVLSENQRNQIQQLAQKTYQKYSQDYQKVYDDAAANLTKAGIPKQFWGFPDFNKISSGTLQSQGGAATQAPVRVNTPEEARKLPPNTTFITPDGRTMVR